MRVRQVPRSFEPASAAVLPIHLKWMPFSIPNLSSEQPPNTVLKSLPALEQRLEPTQVPARQQSEYVLQRPHSPQTPVQ